MHLHINIYIYLSCVSLLYKESPGRPDPIDGSVSKVLYGKL